MALRQDTPDSRDMNRNDKEYCANCVHCKLIILPIEQGQKYYLRVRCTAGKWKKQLGDEKLYKYFTVARRTVDNCTAYEPMGGDTKEYISDLKKNLPIRDEIYTQTERIIE